MGADCDTRLTAVDCGVCVVGSGLAGVSAALAAAETQPVVLLSLGKTLSGSSFYPGSWGLGLIAPRDDADCGNLATKIREVGCGMNTPALTAVLVENIGKEIERLSGWGVEFRMPEGLGSDRTLIPCFDDSYRMWRGLLYPSMTAVFTEKLKQAAVRTIAGEAAVRLLCRDNTVYGVISMDAAGRSRLIRSKAVVLATGGTAALFQHAIPTGDISTLGHSLALQAGAQLQNLEFMQFIPAYMQPAYKTIFNERTFRFARFGGKDQSLLEPYRKQLLKVPTAAAQGGTAVPSLQELLESRAMHGPFTSRLPDKIVDFMLYDRYRKNGGAPVSFDPAIQTEQAGMMIKDYYAWLKKAKGITPESSVVIAPFFHASNGGIVIDEHGATGVAGLFACGECSSGMHGADRIGGLSTANSLVFGRRAGRGAAGYAAGADEPGSTVSRFAEDVQAELYAAVSRAVPDDAVSRGSSGMVFTGGDGDERVAVSPAVPDDAISGNLGGAAFAGRDGAASGNSRSGTVFTGGEGDGNVFSGAVSDGQALSRIRQTLQKTMYENAGIIRSEQGLTSAFKDIAALQSQLEQQEARPVLHTLRNRLMLEGELIVAHAMLTAMLERTESRGSHYRSDYPQENPDFVHRIVLTGTQGKLHRCT